MNDRFLASDGFGRLAKFAANAVSAIASISTVSHAPEQTRHTNAYTETRLLLLLDIIQLLGVLACVCNETYVTPVHTLRCKEYRSRIPLLHIVENPTLQRKGKIKLAKHCFECRD